MSLISAEKAREISNNYQNQTKVRTLLSQVSKEINESARKSCTSCFYENVDLFDGQDDASKEVLKQIIDQGYKVESVMGDSVIVRTRKVKGIKVSW
ncbi:hypothetical protein [Psychrobacter sp.]|uniref:hypothetical protein n=1 Tax=Psychrobacter sp. TaxID=56811 RepID=UPI0035646999